MSHVGIVVYIKLLYELFRILLIARVMAFFDGGGRWVNYEFSCGVVIIQSKRGLLF